MAHKLTLTSLLAFAPDSAQSSVGMAAVIAYLAYILWNAPYVRKGDDRLHLVVQIEARALVILVAR